MHKIKEMLMDELYEYEEKAKKMPGGKISAGDLETLHKLTDTVKNIDKIEMLEDGGYSEDGGRWEAMGSYEGDGSYARGERGSMNRGGSREDGRMGGHSREGAHHYDSDTSYARRKRDSMGRYSRADGKEHMMDKLEDMMESAENDRQREAIHRCMKELERA